MARNARAAIAAAHLKEAPLDVTLRAAEDGDVWCEKLQAIRLPNGSLRRAGGGSVMALPGYAEGAWWIQDAAAALPVRLFGPLQGLDVVDLCAAPGGKTAQLASAGARVTAIDRSTRRLDRLVANLNRLGLPVRAIAGDALSWRPEQPVDAVLLDAPCTATGAIRRHPDVPHLKQPEDVARLSVVQDNLLRAAVEMLRPGGVAGLLHLLARTGGGSGAGRALLRSGAPVARRPIAPDEVGAAEWITDGGDMRTLPCHLPEYDGIDGFYAARLVKLEARHRDGGRRFATRAAVEFGRFDPVRSNAGRRRRRNPRAAGGRGARLPGGGFLVTKRDGCSRRTARKQRSPAWKSS